MWSIELQLLKHFTYLSAMYLVILQSLTHKEDFII